MPRPRFSSSDDLGNEDLDVLQSYLDAEEGVQVDLHTAASIGDVDTVKRATTSEDDLNALNKGGWTPLMYAAYIGHDEVCKLLIDSGRLLIDARSRDKRQTALILAASCGNESTVGILLKHNATVDAIDLRGHSALYYATYCNHAHVVRQLIAAGANPNLAPSDAEDDTWTPKCNEQRPQTIEEFLSQLNLSKYLQTFLEQDVDLPLLLTLSDQELKEIGIKLFGPRKKILNAIARWHQKAPLTLYS